MKVSALEFSIGDDQVALRKARLFNLARITDLGSRVRYVVESSFNILQFYLYFEEQSIERCPAFSFCLAIKAIIIGDLNHQIFLHRDNNAWYICCTPSPVTFRGLVTPPHSGGDRQLYHCSYFASSFTGSASHFVDA